MTDENIINCWNSIGVWGRVKPRCPILESVIHCQNCEKYISAGRKALQRNISNDYEANVNIGAESIEKQDRSDLITAMIVRIGDEWFALPSALCEHVSEEKPVHSVPHRNNTLIKGVVNITGEIQLCFSLGTILGVKMSEDKHIGNRRQLYNCLIVMSFANKRYVFPVSELRGLHKYSESELSSVPATIKTNTASFLTGIIKWNNLNIGCINHEILFSKIEREIQ